MECYIKILIKKKNVNQQPLKQKLTGTIDWSGKFISVNGLIQWCYITPRPDVMC